MHFSISHQLKLDLCSRFSTRAQVIWPLEPLCVESAVPVEKRYIGGDSLAKAKRYIKRGCSGRVDTRSRETTCCSQFVE